MTQSASLKHNSHGHLQTEAGLVNAFLPSAAHTCSNGCRNLSASGKAPVRRHLCLKH